MGDDNETAVSEGRPHGPPLVERTGWVSVLLDGLSSGKLALVLIFLLILFALVGAVLPQEGQMAAFEVAQWQVDHATVTRIAAPLGLFHVFRCWPFLATILVLAVNTLTCTVLHFHRKGGLRALKGPVAIERTGFVLLHLSLILLFAGGFWSAAADFDGQIILTEGQEFTDRHDHYLELHEGPLRRERHTGVTIRLLDVDIKYEEERYPVAVTSSLEVLAKGTEVASGVVEVNKPYTFQGLSFTQDDTGFSPRLVIRDATRGGLLFDSFIALKTFRTEAGREYRDFLPMPFLKRRIIVTLYPSFTRENDKVLKTGDVPNNPLLLLKMEDESGQVVETRHVEVDSRVMLGKYAFAFADLRRWSSFRVGDDPGYPLVCVALWLGLGAMLLRYLPDLRHWSAELRPPTGMPAVPSSYVQPLHTGIDADSVSVRLP